MVKIEFTTDGAAFCDSSTGQENEYYRRTEIISILKGIIYDIDDGTNYGSLLDVNGNKVGTWTIS